MSDVFKCLYEAPADLPTVINHLVAKHAAETAIRAYVLEVGAEGFHTYHRSGAIVGLIFLEAPPAWKVVQNLGGGHYLCVPKNTKAAREVRDAFRLMPLIPTARSLAISLGAPTESTTDGSALSYATAHLIELPTLRCFGRVPLQIGDAWVPPEAFSEVSEAEYMRAIAAHNQLARGQ